MLTLHTPILLGPSGYNLCGKGHLTVEINRSTFIANRKRKVMETIVLKKDL